MISKHMAALEPSLTVRPDGEGNGWVFNILIWHLSRIVKKFCCFCILSFGTEYLAVNGQKKKAIYSVLVPFERASFLSIV